MKIFLSYASEDRAQAEEIQLALAGAGHDVFFDRESLPAGGDYHERIKRSIDEADLFVFLVTPDSVAVGGYALTEMGHARARWAHPKGRLIPVLGRPTPFASIPAYLKSVTVLEPAGNTPAEVLAAVDRLAASTGLPAGVKFGAVGAALVLGVAAFFFLRPKPPEPAPPPPSAEAAVPDPLQLRFSYTPVAGAKVSLDDTLRVNLQTKRRIVDGERLARQVSGFYSYNTAYPAGDDRIVGTLTREVRESSLDAAPAPARFCLKRPTPVTPSDEQHVHLDCAENGSCQIHFPSPKWLDACPVEPVKTSRAFGWMSQAVAADTPRRWTVPSAQTLDTHKDQLKGVGYTLVTLATDAFRDPAVIGVELDVRVNGVPIHEDGLVPALRPVPNDPARTFRHTFALESLDFEGALAGCEKIVLTLRPRLAGGQGVGEALSATLAYVALRDKAQTTVPFGKASLTWDARYVIPADEWSHEAFITSVSFSVAGGDAAAAAARERAVELKRAFDRLDVRHDGRPVVAVIRPPLTQTGDKLAYGLTAGVVQPSGQIRFTFSPTQAHAVGDSLLAARAASYAAQRVIDRAKYIYRVGGTPERQSTPTPPGVCRHVSGG